MLEKRRIPAQPPREMKRLPGNLAPLRLVPGPAASLRPPIFYCPMTANSEPSWWAPRWKKSIRRRPPSGAAGCHIPFICMLAWRRAGSSSTRFPGPTARQPPATSRISKRPGRITSYRPNIPPGAIDADVLMIHGFISQAGRFQALSILFPPEFAEAKFVLDALAQWQFRPATQNGQNVLVEVLLIIPDEEP